MCRMTEYIVENSLKARSLPAGQKLRMAVTVSNLLCPARSSRPREAEYSRKSAVANDGLQRTNRALIPNVVNEGRQAEQALASNSMVELSRRG
jgi:hypothetical protein